MEVDMKIRVSIIVLVWIFFSNTLFSQSVQWVKQIGAKGYCIKTDKNGNFYITGSFENTVQFDDVSITSRGMTDIYVLKYSPDGKLIWVKTAGGELYDLGFSLATNPTGDNLYVTGFMNDAVFKDTVVNGYPFFIANYDLSGNVIWVQSLSTYRGGGTSGASSITTDSQDHLYLTGSAYGLIIPPDSGFGNSTFFIIKYDKSGNKLWIKGTSPTSNGLAVQPAQQGITCDINNNVYVAGAIQTNKIEFDANHILIPEGLLNLFVVKYDPSGKVILAIQSKGPGQAYPLSIAVDTSSNIYLTGCFEGSVIFGNITLNSFGSFDIFTVKYDKNGELLWVRQAGSTQYDSGRNIKVDNNGNVYVIGINSLSAGFNGNIINKGGAFLAKYDTDGNLIYAKNIFHVNDNIMVSGNNFTVNDFALIGDKDFLVIGFINETVYFDSLQITAPGIGNLFIAKIMDNTMGVVRKDPIPTSMRLFQNYPNPFNPATSISFELSTEHYTTLKIYDLLGREVTTLVSEKLPAGKYRYQWSAKDLPSGVYFYRLQSCYYNETKKLLLVK
jgi:hypothetical protein